MSFKRLARPRVSFVATLIVFALSLVAMPAETQTNRAPAAPPASPVTIPAVRAGTPPLGRYNCYYTGITGNYGGWLKLREGGTYQEGYGETVRGTGRYTFRGTFTWSGGPYDIAGWDALYWPPNRYEDGSVRTGTGQDQHIIALRKRGDTRLRSTGTNPFPLHCYGLYPE
jgi:hypothetical protein